MVTEINEDFGTGWENEPSIRDLKNDWILSKSSHDAQIASIDEWLEVLHIKSEEEKTALGRSSISPKLVRKNNEWRYTSLSEPFLNTPDIFNVDPITEEDVLPAKQNGLLLNNQINTKIDKVNFIDRYVRKCVDEGTVIVRVGWKNTVKERTMVYPVYEIRPTENKRQLADLERSMNTDPTLLPAEMIEAISAYQETNVPHYPVHIDEEEEVVQEFVDNHPTLEVCDTENVYIDPSCNDDLDKANFIIYSFETSRAELEESSLYKNVDMLPDSSNDPLSDGDHASKWEEDGFHFTDKPRQKLVAYEYWGFWDIDGSGLVKPIVATWVGDVLIRLEDNPYPDGKLPFVTVPYLPVDNSVYGEPDCELIRDNQKVVGAVTRGMIDLMARSANGQTGVRKGSLDLINRRKFDSGLDYEFNDMGDAQNSIFMHQYPEIPMSVYNMINMQNQEAESLSGVKVFAQGITGAGLGETAAAAGGALDAAARREIGILRRLANGMRKIGHKIVAMNQVFMADEEVVRVTNKAFTSIRRDDLEGKFDLRLSISTAESDEQKAQELAFMLQTTGQQFGIGMYKMILAEIADLRKMPQLANEIRTYEPEPDPAQQLEMQLQQIELQKAQAEVAKIQAETQKILAEAGNKAADTDRKNLDYIEQENGVNHARDLEKDQAQSQGNMRLEAFKSALAQEESTQANPI